MGYGFQLAQFVSGLDRVESLLRSDGRAAGALAGALVADLEKALVQAPGDEDLREARAPVYAQRSGPFGREWEKALAEGVAALCGLLRWRLLVILADLTGEVERYYQAALARPDLAVGRAALGCALARAEKFGAAALELRLAVTADPLDRQAARAYFGVLGKAGLPDEQRRFAAAQRRLAQEKPQHVPKEEWFDKCPPAGDELVSIVMLCSNQLDYTRLCVESLFRHTRRPYELIVVDNGSTDGTPEYLAEIQRRCRTDCLSVRTTAEDGYTIRPTVGEALPARVVVIHNETNLGFPKGCNQGLAEAKGEYVVLLNNDTVVTEGWLEGLVRLLLWDWPHTGMAGPVSNGAPAPQYVAGFEWSAAGGAQSAAAAALCASPAALDELDSFAARRRRDFKGQALNSERITGFCLAIRRDVLEAVGGQLDEGYGMGYFEDDDLCVRVREAGFRLGVALDVFIHHFGTKTYDGLGIDARKLMLEGFARFKEKWGEERAKAYRLPADVYVSRPEETSGADDANARMARARNVNASVSIAIIAKNEEANLGDCLASVAGLADEIIVVDTGSTDRTREIAARGSCATAASRSRSISAPGVSWSR